MDNLLVGTRSDDRESTDRDHPGTSDRHHPGTGDRHPRNTDRHRPESPASEFYRDKALLRHRTKNGEENH